MNRPYWLLLVGLVVLFSGFPMAAYADTDPDDAFDEATSIEVGYDNAILDGTLSSDEDIDIYRFTTEANRTYVIETFNIQGTPNMRATGLYLFDSNREELRSDERGNNGTGDANARIVQTFTRAGSYYIRVSSARFENWSGSYSLRVLPKYDEPGAGWDAENDFEPNNTRQIANEITPSLSGAVTRRLFNHNSFVTNYADVDYYRFEAEAGYNYVIETFNIQGQPDGNATALRLYNSSGEQIQDDKRGANGTGDANARIVFPVKTTGEYFVSVMRDDLYAWAGTYSLRILPQYDHPDAEWDAENNFEPNDTFSTANLLEVGSENAVNRRLFDHSGFVTNGSDYDYYRFEAKAGQTYIVQTFNVQENTSGDGTGIYLYNPEGSIIADDERGRNGEGSIDAEIVQPLTVDGTYFILVKDERNANWTGAYSLRVCENNCAQSNPTPSGSVFLPLIIR
ncbi:MAG: PPC domain-containing protein [Chloroflexota bacterium]